MKRPASKYAAAALCLLAAFSCGKEQRTLYDGPDYIMFTDTLYTFGVVDNEECFEVPICATRPSSRDRNIGVEILVKKSDAVNGCHFILESSTAVLPAGELTTSVKIKGIADNISINSDVRAVLKLVIPQENVWDMYGTETSVELRKCCPFSRDSFVGYMLVSSAYALD